MKSIYPELALCGIKNQCARTDTVFLHISEVSEGTVSLSRLQTPLSFNSLTKTKSSFSKICLYDQLDEVEQVSPMSIKSCVSVSSKICLHN